MSPLKKLKRSNELSSATNEQNEEIAPETPSRKAPAMVVIPTPAPKELIGGYNFDVLSIFQLPSYFSNIKQFKWAKLMGSTMQVTNLVGKPITATVTGRITKAQMGIYGDLNPKYANSLVDDGIRNLTLQLVPLPDFVDKFLEAVTIITDIQNKISEAFEIEAQTKHRCVKGPALIEFRRKIAVKMTSKDGLIPDDVQGTIILTLDSKIKLWQEAKKKNYCANIIPGGVFDIDGERVPFEQYGDVLKNGVDVVIAARIECAKFGLEHFVRLVPVKIKVISYVSPDYVEPQYEDVF